MAINRKLKRPYSTFFTLVLRYLQTTEQWSNISLNNKNFILLIDKQDAYGPRVAHLSDIATADMQMLCNIFQILSSQLMKRSSFKQFLILKKNIYGMPVN